MSTRPHLVLGPRTRLSCEQVEALAVLDRPRVVLGPDAEAAMERSVRVLAVLRERGAAVYGTTDAVPIPEDAAMQPESVYGETKLMTERMIHAFHTAHGLPYTILRYFNVCGAAPAGDIGEAHPSQSHLIELACMTALIRTLAALTQAALRSVSMLC